MYSKTAIEMYAELLKVAGSTVSAELEKNAWGLPGFGRAARGALQVGEGNLLHTLESSGGAAAAPGTRRLLGMFRKAPTPRAAPNVVETGIPHGIPKESPTDLLPRQTSEAIPTGPHGPSLPDNYRDGYMSPGKAIGGGLAAAGAVGAGGYGLGRHLQAQEDKSKRNIAFGAGAAAGLAAPSLLRGIANTAQNFALSPTSLLPGRY